jgi:hypothetical protein
MAKLQPYEVTYEPGLGDITLCNRIMQAYELMQRLPKAQQLALNAAITACLEAVPDVTSAYGDNIPDLVRSLRQPYTVLVEPSDDMQRYYDDVVYLTKRLTQRLEAQDDDNKAH